MHMIIYRDVNAAFVGALENLKLDGKEVGPRGNMTTEMDPGVAFKIMDVEHNVIDLPERRINPYFLMAEMCWILGGMSDARILAKYMPAVAKFYDEGHTFGAYGPRFVQQLDYVLDALRRDRDTRQAVMTFWRPCIWQGDHRVETRDVPCTVSLQFIHRDGRLNLIVYMRSNDIWKGFSYDFFNFTQILKLVCGTMRMKLGTYTHMCGSMHLYQTDALKASVLLGAYPIVPPVSKVSGPNLDVYPISVSEFPYLLELYSELSSGVRDIAINCFWNMTDPRDQIVDILVRKIVHPEHTVHDLGWRRLVEDFDRGE